MFSKIHEECGVFGIYTGGGTDVAGLTYSALFALQHRGQESCGIAVNDDGVISGYKDLGLVGEVFPPERLQKLGGGQRRWVMSATPQPAGRAAKMPSP